MPIIRILPGGQRLEATENESLLDCLIRGGALQDAPCGGNGQCGKCRVWVDGVRVLACRTRVDRDILVELPRVSPLHVLDSTCTPQQVCRPRTTGPVLAFDIGTTSLVCYLLDGSSGRELAKGGVRNPQCVYGADVVSRIRAALAGKMEHLTGLVRDAMTGLVLQVCREACIAPEEISVVSVVGNPAMQQLFLGISPENLAAVPFGPAIRRSAVDACAKYLPVCAGASLLTVPDISGFVGADTIGCVLSSGMYQSDEMTLLVDIGTNGEMVLGSRERMIACSTAAGPALEGAGISCGIRGEPGAIDHVWIENGALGYSVLGGTEARGICGSGIIDAVAAALKLGWLNKRGRIQPREDGSRVIPLGEGLCLTQEDIRQVQLAKGAVHSGILLMARQLGICLDQIDRVLLAGAFGTYLDPKSACRIGLLPEELEQKITVLGNAAGSGAKLLALDRDALELTDALAEKIEFLELAALEAFSGTFARSMLFREEV